jgi:hypothetical protein
MNTLESKAHELEVGPDLEIDKRKAIERWEAGVQAWWGDWMDVNRRMAERNKLDQEELPSQTSDSSALEKTYYESELDGWPERETGELLNFQRNMDEI